MGWKMKQLLTLRIQGGNTTLSGFSLPLNVSWYVYIVSNLSHFNSLTHFLQWVFVSYLICSPHWAPQAYHLVCWVNLTTLASFPFWFCNYSQCSLPLISDWLIIFFSRIINTWILIFGQLTILLKSIWMGTRRCFQKECLGGILLILLTFCIRMVRICWLCLSILLIIQGVFLLRVVKVVIMRYSSN